MLGQVAPLRATAALVIVGLLTMTGSVAQGRTLPARASVSPARPFSQQLTLEEWARPGAARLPALALVVQGPTNAPGAPLTPLEPAEEPHVFGKWWFWAAIGAVVATTVILFVVASQSSDSPRTQLGDMEIFK